MKLFDPHIHMTSRTTDDYEAMAHAGIVTGLRQTPEQIVAAALQEDADVIGLSILSGAHLHVCRRVMALLRERGMDDVLVLVGGIVPDVDVAVLKDMGVRGVFLPGSSMQEIVAFIRTHVRAAPTVVES
jgi:methylmalonyl-CoA mutase C-terminal domain/subunit